LSLRVNENINNLKILKISLITTHNISKTWTQKNKNTKWTIIYHQKGKKNCFPSFLLLIKSNNNHQNSNFVTSKVIKIKYKRITFSILLIFKNIVHEKDKTIISFLIWRIYSMLVGISLFRLRKTRLKLHIFKINNNPKHFNSNKSHFTQR
jgi:hypothetical protein